MTDKIVNEVITNKLIGELSEAVHTIFIDSISFSSFLVKIEVTHFNDLIPPVAYNDLVPLYLKSLKLKNELGLFVIEFLNEVKKSKNLNDPIIIKFIDSLNQLVIRDCQGDITGLQRELFQSVLLFTNLPFLGRMDFRDLFYESLNNNESKVIFVKGTSRSGMSYLKEYFQNITSKFQFIDFKEINVHNYLEDPKVGNDKGLLLAKLMAAEFGIKIDLNNSEINKLKFVQFAQLLREKLKENQSIPLIFIHDFHKVTNLLEDVNHFIYEIVKKVHQSFPKTILVLAGFDYENLQEWNILSQKCKVYHIQDIIEEDLAQFAGILFERYCDKIALFYKKQINRAEFEKEYVNRLLPVCKNGIANVAEVIMKDIGNFEKI